MLEQIQSKISALVSQYAEEKYKTKDFIPGQTVIPPAGKVIGELELQYMVEASLDGWQ
jgi:CDP-6-deoxy-D-xylo-4-hexulose-3-dehydrase